MQRLMIWWTVLSLIGLIAGPWPCSAQEIGPPRPTSWGALHPFRLANARSYVAILKNRPADGRLVLPVDLESVFVASIGMPVETKAGEVQPSAEGVAPRVEVVYLPLEFDAETGQLSIPLSNRPKIGAGAEVSLRAADQTHQDPSGRIVFPAQSARVNGEAAKLESTGSHHRIGFWTDPADRVVWDFAATRWGRYEVFLTYSTASPDGGIATISLGGESLDVELPSTGSWYRYHTVSAGKLYLKTEGKHELSVVAKKLVGPALMNLKAVWLETTAESDARLVQADDGSLTLHARDARVSGTKLRYEPKPEKNTLGYWTNPRDSAAWKFEVREPGTFEIEVLQGCGAGQGGSTMQILILGNKPVEFVVEETGHFQNFVPRIVGRVKLDRAAAAAIIIQPKKIAKAAACDIRQIRLIPVEAEPTR